MPSTTREINSAKIEELKNMQIHASRYIDSDLQVIRVPGGWIYNIIDARQTTSVFVPITKAVLLEHLI